MPDRKYYDPDGMSPTRKQEFESWYDEKVPIQCQTLEARMHEIPGAI